MVSFPPSSKRERRTSAVSHRRNYVFLIGFLALCIILFLHTPEYTNPEYRNTTVETNPIRQISILGERNSGTRWTFEYVYSSEKSKRAKSSIFISHEILSILPPTSAMSPNVSITPFQFREH